MIWIVGNKGMLGSDVQSLLQTHNYPLVMSDRDVDITDVKQLEEFTRDKRIDWIINCAAYTAVDHAEEDEKSAYSINSAGAGNIANISERLGAKLIHFSTDYVFDGSGEGPYRENDETNPKSVYGNSKLQGENLIKSATENFFIIRISWLFGRNGNNFVNTMLKLFNSRDEVNVVNDQRGSPTCTIDTAELVKIIIDNNHTNYGIYHFSSIGNISWYDFACEIYRISSELKLIKSGTSINPVNSESFPVKAVRPVNSLLDKSKIISGFDISIRDWRDCLREYLLKTLEDVGRRDP